MRKQRIKNVYKCPFCGRPVCIDDKDTDSFIRENKYLQKARQYYHKTCYQKFYSGEKIEYDRTTSSTKSN